MARFSFSYKFYRYIEVAEEISPGQDTAGVVETGIEYIQWIKVKVFI